MHQTNINDPYFNILKKIHTSFKNILLHIYEWVVMFYMRKNNYSINKINEKNQW